MSKATRREFLKNTVLSAAGAGMALTVFRPESLLADPQIDRRSYSAGKFALELDGVTAGWLYSVEGGHATSDVVNEKIGPDRIQKRPIGNVKPEPITLTCGTGMSKAFYEWIKAAFDRQSLRKSGAIIACDYNYNEVSRTEWNNALIEEVTFPALDAASKDAAKMTIKLSPEFTRLAASKPGAKPYKGDQTIQKKWLPSNFRLQIPRLDCSKVNRIEALTLRPNAAAPNLVITLPEAHAAPFFSRKEAFSTGQLDFLAEDLRESLFALRFQNLGILKIAPDKVAAPHGENIRRVQMEMSCERIQFAYNPAWA